MSTDRTIAARIFVVGAPRSGTTLVQSLLAAHSDVTSFTESHFFDAHFLPLSRFSRSVLTRDPRPRVVAFLLENGEASLSPTTSFDSGLHRVLGFRPILPFLTRRVALRLLGILDELALRRGLTRWVEKTPRHLHHLGLLESVCAPEAPASFVHVIRRGEDVVASLHLASRTWERHYDLDTCAARWNSDLRLSLRRADSPHDHFLFYEDLTAEPESTLSALLADLDLRWEPAILDGFADAAARLVTPQETWKTDVGRDIHPSKRSEVSLSEKQLERVVGRLNSDLYDEIRARVRSGRTPKPPPGETGP